MATSSTNMLWDLLQSVQIDEESILRCLNDHPDYCARVVNDKLPIYMAIEQFLSFDIIKKMLSCNPACCMWRNSRGKLLIHDILNDHEPNFSSDIALLIINGNTEASKVVNGYGNLPLHLECKNQCRYEVIIKLLDIYPDAIRIKNVSSGNLPLHMILLDTVQPSVDVIKLVFDKYPDAARVSNNINRMPLHYMFELYYLSYKRYVPYSSTPTCSSMLSIQYKALTISMFDMYQSHLVPNDDNIVACINIPNNPIAYLSQRTPYRLLLNLTPHYLSAEQLRDYHERNYQPRAQLLHHVYQLSSYHHMVSCSSPSSDNSQEQFVRHLSKIRDACSSVFDVRSFELLLSIFAATGRMDISDKDDDHDMKYGWMKGDDIGCVLLRKVLLLL